MMKRVCVFTGSREGKNLAYRRVAGELGKLLAERGIGVVYGGGHVGLMGVLADAALAGGGEVIGVIPRGMAGLELAHEGVTELRVVESMHDRKAAMEKLSDGFIVLPGGVGTLEEMIEVISWIYLGIIRKPLGLINQDGYYDPLLALFKHSAEEGFMTEYYEKLFVVGESPEKVLSRMENFSPPPGPMAGQSINNL